MPLASFNNSKTPNSKHLFINRTIAPIEKFYITLLWSSCNTILIWLQIFSSAAATHTAA